MPKSNSTIWKIFDESYRAAFFKLTDVISKINTLPSITCDEWTSRSGQRYMNVNAHFAKESFSLGLIRISEAATSKYLSEKLKETLVKFKINCKFITTDGASVMNKMSKEADLYQLKCLLHGMNLAIQDLFYSRTIEQVKYEVEEDSDEEGFDVVHNNLDDEIDMNANFCDVIGNIRSLMKFYRQPKRHDELQKIVFDSEKKEILPEIDVPTRWNSILPMLRKFIVLFKYMRIHHANINKDFIPNNHYVVLSEKIVSIMSEIEKCMKTIGRESSNLMVADIAISNLVTTLSQMNLDLADKMKELVIKRVNERRSVLSDILWECSEMETIQAGQNLFFTKPTNEDLEAVSNFVKTKSLISADVDLIEVALNAKKFLPNKIDKDAIVENIINIKPSSITCERAFSVCSRIMVPMRGRLSSKHFHKILFMQQNKHHLF